MIIGFVQSIYHRRCGRICNVKAMKTDLSAAGPDEYRAFSQRRIVSDIRKNRSTTAKCSDIPQAALMSAWFFALPFANAKGSGSETVDAQTKTH